jgi:hypothetical protein
MNSIKLLFLFITILFHSNIFAQIKSPEFGQFSSEEMQMKICSFDPEAEAVKLLDEGESVYDLYNKLITTRRVRIKILKSTGIEQANVQIPFYTLNDYETAELIEAITYNFDELGNPAPSRLDKNLVFKEKSGQYYSLMKFAMPAVKEGSIIEYKYIIKNKGFAIPDDWKFQDNIPTVKSSYFLDITARAEVTYLVQRRPDLPIIEKKDPKEGEVYFEMNHIPALRHEPFMDSERDYVQKVKFQLSGVISFKGVRREINKTWKDLAYDLMTEKNFGSQLDKDLKIDGIKEIIKEANSDSKKLKAIYGYVVNNFSWDGYFSIYASNGLKEVAENKKGSAAEINLLLINLLKTNGIEAYPLLAAERTYGKVNGDFPFIDQFNKTIAFVIADGRQYILDATQKNCPAELVPYEFLNTLAFLVDKKKFNIVNISSRSNSYRNKININAELTAEGTIKATTLIESFAYSRQQRLNSLQNGRINFIKDQFEDPAKNLVVDSFGIANPEIDSLPLMQYIKYNQHLEGSANTFFLNANLFSGLEKNPFISSNRFTDINFGYPHYLLLEETIKLPKGCKIDLPEDISLVLPDPDIRIFRQIKKENDAVRITMMFVQNTTLVPATSYNTIKNFYKTMVDKLNEPMTVTISN